MMINTPFERHKVIAQKPENVKTPNVDGRYNGIY